MSALTRECKHCGGRITDEGVSPRIWWHLANSVSHCPTTQAEPVPDEAPPSPEATQRARTLADIDAADEDD